MMTVEPTCRFCHRKLAQLTPFQSRGKTVYSTYCMFCRSEQIFEREGKPLEYSFKVGTYLCMFPISGLHKLEIYKINTETAIPEPKVVLTLDFIPHNLRPDNTTEERIKTLILFS